MSIFDPCLKPFQQSVHDHILAAEPGEDRQVNVPGEAGFTTRTVGDRTVFHTLGLIEQWGSGIQRMTAACRDAGLPPPMLEEIGIRFRLTLSAVRVTTPVLDEKDQAILDTLTDEGKATSDLAQAINLTPRATRTRLTKLIERGLVREVGTSPHDPKRRYYRVP